MSSLPSRDKQSLLELARRSLTLAVQGRESGQPLSSLPENEIRPQAAGAFVTLRHRGRLRGCIGQLSTNISLAQIVAHCAKSAALEDPRFDPVHPEELDEIEIELSVLSPPENVTVEQIEIGKHGLLVSRGWERGVLLPQVAEQFHWSAQRFLEETCAKAGFEKDAWQDPATRIQAFTAEVFSESDFRSTPAR
jgi:AmmeMemoRadiSam system protein A